LAGLAVAYGEPEQAARLFGAAAALREAIGVVLRPVVHADYERAEAVARTALGDTAFAAAREAGHALSLEQAIAEAAGVAPGAVVARPSPWATAVDVGLTPRQREVR
jgi:hypothetical protein